MTGFKSLMRFIVLYGLLQDVTSQIVGKPSYGLVGPGVNEPAVLQCTFQSSVDPDKMHYSWLNEDHSVLSNDDVEWVPNIQSELEVGDNYRKLILTLDRPSLDDQGQYACQVAVSGNISKGYSFLSINELPEVSLVTETTSVVEGDLSRIASCYANISKPAPEMWFVDSSGNTVETTNAIDVKDCGNGLSNSTLYLVKRMTREDNGETFYCNVRHVNRSEVYTERVGSINVNYPPSVLIASNYQDSVQLLAEGSGFSVGCNVEGNPFPAVTWTFHSDVASDSTTGTDSSSTDLPSNFILVDDGTRIVTTAVVAADQSMTNNGTFTCTAENNLGVESASFRLQVYELPTTTTPEATTAVTSDNADEVAVVVTVAAPIAAGANAAVIAGVVAVAIFILVVTIILLLRYFMSHKGEYYTNELKASDGVGSGELSDDDDDDFPRTEADLLGDKKRTEHFL